LTFVAFKFKILFLQGEKKVVVNMRSDAVVKSKGSTSVNIFIFLNGKFAIISRFFVNDTGGHSIAPPPQAPVRNRQTRKVANAKVRIGWVRLS